MNDLRTPDEWLKTPEFKGIVVLDPDGWDRRGFQRSWPEPIDHATFTGRLVKSTCTWPSSMFTQSNEEARDDG